MSATRAACSFTRRRSLRFLPAGFSPLRRGRGDPQLRGERSVQVSVVPGPWRPCGRAHFRRGHHASITRVLQGAAGGCARGMGGSVETGTLVLIHICAHFPELSACWCRCGCCASRATHAPPSSGISGRPFNGCARRPHCESSFASVFCIKTKYMLYLYLYLYFASSSVSCRLTSLLMRECHLFSICLTVRLGTFSFERTIGTIACLQNTKYQIYL